MPLLPHVCIELPHPGESPDGSETTKITKRHDYNKVTDIWARWYTANTNAVSIFLGDHTFHEFVV